ncbi:MAG: hypothetical protein LC114_04235 [Bryobacterales bacterium]|nr:hypothetical protein [Bryobacterales bacterium]
MFFTLIPVLALLSNYYRVSCLINVGTEGFLVPCFRPSPKALRQLRVFQVAAINQQDAMALAAAMVRRLELTDFDALSIIVDRWWVYGDVAEIEIVGACGGKLSTTGPAWSRAQIESPTTDFWAVAAAYLETLH